MTRSIDWTPVAAADVEWAIAEFERLGDDFFDSSGFRPSLTYDLHAGGSLYPPKAILGAAYEHATGERLQPSDFEGGRTGAATVLGSLGFDVRPKR